MATRLELQLLLRDIDNQIQRDTETVAQLRARIDAASEAQNPNQRAIATLNTQIATLTQSINGLRAERLSAQSQLASLSEQAAGQADVRRIDNATLPAAATAATAATAAAPQRVAQDDTATPVSTAQVQSGEQGTNVTGYEILPRPNKLDRFYSYTYEAAVYMLSPAQYDAILNGKEPTIDGYFLLFQTGGAAPNKGGVRPPPTPPVQGDLPIDPQLTQPTNFGDGGRNPFFGQDFYIDSITMDTQLLGKATRSAHGTASIKINVVEPQGITLIDRLWSAANNIQQKTLAGVTNFTATQYMLVIKFYGYDEEGNLIQPIRANVDGGGTNNTGAVIIKYIPFLISTLNWSVQSKGVTYEWICTPVSQQVAAGQGRGTVPQDMQISATTVKELLGQTIIETETTPDPPAANPGQNTTASEPIAERRDSQRGAAIPPPAAPAPSTAQGAPNAARLSGGLMGALNRKQQELVREGKYEIADQYEIEFIDGTNADEKISEAKIQLRIERREIRQTASGAPTSGPNGQTRNLLSESGAVENATRSFSITAGQSIVAAIELAIRNSNYITNQSLTIVNADGTEVPNPAKISGPMKWFAISFTATQLGFDKKRNDYAYKIRYVVRPYIVRNFNSKYFPVSRYQGVHKSYPYWFTGTNTAVLEYQETLNSLYTITTNSTDPKYSGQAKLRDTMTSSVLDLVKYQYYPTSGESGAGGRGREYENNANAAEVIYNPADLGEAKLKILGDPDWIQQGSLWKAYTSGTFSIESASGFNPDGSIAFDAGQPMFEIVWQRPEDYDLETGLADPFSGGYSGNANVARRPLQSRVYNAYRVVSEFNQGKFTQQLYGALFYLLTPKARSAQNAAAAAAAAEAEAGTGRETAGTPRRGAPASSSDVQQQRARGFDPVGGAGEFGTNANVTSTATGAGGQLAAQSGSPAAASPNPTREQLQQSDTYKRAIARGIDQAKALDYAANEWQRNATRSNGQAVGVQTTAAAGTLPQAAGPGGLTEQQRRQQIASQGQPPAGISRNQIIFKDE